MNEPKPKRGPGRPRNDGTPIGNPRPKQTRAKARPETKAKLSKASGHSATLVEIAGLLDDLVARRLGFGVTPDDLELDSETMATARKALTSGRAAISMTLRVDRASIFVDAFVSDDEAEERQWTPMRRTPDDPLHSALFGPMFNVADM